MPDELLFTVHGSTAIPAQPLTLAEAGLRERRDLQEWVKAHPEILGSDILIVTMEFDHWQSSGGRNSDRLDILGLHTSGELVVGELKRDKAPDTVEMQAIKYAAMVSRFSLETIAEQHARYLTQQGNSTDEDAAAKALAVHGDITVDSLRRPRLVLLASEYPQSTLNAVVWLREMGINITLMQYRAYRTGAEIAISVSQLLPIPNVEDFTISPRQAEVRAVQETRQRRQDVGVVARIVSAGLIENDTAMTIRPGGVNEELRAQLDTWLDEQQSRRTARWNNDAKHPLTWDADGEQYTPSGLARQVLLLATATERQIRGTEWWVDADGQSLVDLGGSLGGSWNHDSFMGAVTEQGGADDGNVCEAIFAWGEGVLDRWDWGAGSTAGSMIAVVGDRGVGQVPFTVWTYGRIEIGLQYLANWQPFADERRRRTLRDRLTTIPGIEITDEYLSKRPAFSVQVLRDPDARAAFFTTMEWVTSEIRAKDPRQQTALPQRSLY